MEVYGIRSTACSCSVFLTTATPGLHIARVTCSSSYATSTAHHIAAFSPHQVYQDLRGPSPTAREVSTLKVFPNLTSRRRACKAGGNFLVPGPRFSVSALTICTHWKPRFRGLLCGITIGRPPIISIMKCARRRMALIQYADTRPRSVSQCPGMSWCGRRIRRADT